MGLGISDGAGDDASRRSRAVPVLQTQRLAELNDMKASETERIPLSPSSSQLDDPGLYLNRELSWLQFNARVLEEAENNDLPLLERVKFLAIFATNLDEFFMIRVSGLRRQIASGAAEIPPDAMTPSEQMLAINRDLTDLLKRQHVCWSHELLPRLREAGIHILRYDELTDHERTQLRTYFQRDVYPILTPLAIDPTHPFPHISNLSLNLAVVINDAGCSDCFARVKLPDAFGRLIPLSPDPDTRPAGDSSILASPLQRFVWLEEIVADNLDLLFPGIDIKAAYLFRVTRDADVTIEEDEAADLITTVEEQLDLREFNSVVRLELQADTPDHLADILARNLQVPPYLVYREDIPIGMASLMEMTSLDRPELKYPVFQPAMPAVLSNAGHLLDAIREQDLLLYHPYQSFVPVVEFVRQAASDPDVLAIKQTLYRVNPKSPIIEALLDARINGKQVAVLVELKARFDEERNIEWARKLEDEGVHVVYGVRGLKTHSKVCLVVRREKDGIRRYVHLGTGNYNVVTSRIYTDLSYFTCDPVIGSDVSDLFNALTGYSRKTTYERLLVAPATLRHSLIQRIEREIDRQRRHGDGYLSFKMNALVDKACIQALYRASQAGVEIHLQVRGICCLRPGVPGISDRITVTSIVGRFLEHARIFYFRNGGEDEVLVGSADLMPRNLDRRVELLFPVLHSHWKQVLIHEVLAIGIRDNVQARSLRADGSYRRIRPSLESPRISSQEYFVGKGGVRYPGAELQSRTT
jgi:polyphosphate kinase